MQRPGTGPGRWRDAEGLGSETVADLIGPEALEADQGDVHAPEIVGRDAADMLDRDDVLVVEVGDDLVDLGALLGEADAHRAPVHARALMVQEAHLDELLE